MLNAQDTATEGSPVKLVNAQAQDAAVHKTFLTAELGAVNISKYQ